MAIRKLAVLAIAAIASAGAASASVVSSLPGGVTLAIPTANLLGESGPQTVAPGVIFTSTQPSAYGYTGGYGFSTNGFWSGVPMIGLDDPTGSFQLAFATPISGFLGELNWTVDDESRASIAIYDASGALLESLTLENGVNLVNPGYWGFSRAAADISFVRFNNEYIGVRDITTLTGAVVPEPASWAMLIAGFGLVGAAARRRRTAVAA